MAIPLNATLHYQATFTLRGGDPEQDWLRVVRQVRGWIGHRVDDNTVLGRRWFFVGGRWKGRGRMSVVTGRHPAASGDEAPTHWAVRFEHPCKDFDFRQWATDVGVTVARDGSLEVAVTVRHWVLPTYMGEEPSAPIPSSPRLVEELLGLSGLLSSDAGWAVLATPHALHPGQGADFKGWLEGSERRLPVVYVSCLFPEGVPSLDGERLARLVVGAAHVVVATHSEVDRETEWLFSKNYRCWGGMVRVYLPPVRFDSPSDFKRHRFFRMDGSGTPPSSEPRIQLAPSSGPLRHLGRPSA